MNRVLMEFAFDLTVLRHTRSYDMCFAILSLCDLLSARKAWVATFSGFRLFQCYLWMAVEEISVQTGSLCRYFVFEYILG